MSSYGGKDRELVSADNLSPQDGVEPCLAQIARVYSVLETVPLPLLKALSRL